jgi:hypothetical protein
MWSSFVFFRKGVVVFGIIAWLFLLTTPPTTGRLVSSIVPRLGGGAPLLWW